MSAANVSIQFSEANDALWYPDSTTLSHMIPFEGILTSKLPYRGNTDGIIGNRATLPISHAGQPHLQTSAKFLVLNNVSHVPDLQYNLLSIHQLCNDNNCTVKFDASFVHIKDKAMGTTILEGASDRGVYPVRPPSHHALTTLHAPRDIWHNRLATS